MRNSRIANQLRKSEYTLTGIEDWESWFTHGTTSKDFDFELLTNSGHAFTGTVTVYAKEVLLCEEGEYTPEEREVQFEDIEVSNVNCYDSNDEEHEVNLWLICKIEKEIKNQF